VKIIGICCSPRKEKTTYYALSRSLEAIEKSFPQVDTTLLDLAGKRINGCIACGACTKQLRCSQEDDFNAFVPILEDHEVGGIIVATPVYLGSMTSLCKAFMDRCVMFRRNGFLFRNRVGGALAVGGVRNGGQSATIQDVHAVMLVQDMVIVGDGRPGSHFGGSVWSGHPGGIEKDEIGLTTAVSLGIRVAELALQIHT
jgi:multimeric flavodoxin WrbA